MLNPISSMPPAAPAEPAAQVPIRLQSPPGARRDSDLREDDFPAVRKNSPSDLGFTVALLVVALVPRLFVALAWAREPVWDGHYYHFGAERIAEGLGYSEDVTVGGVEVWKPWTHYPVGYSALLALGYKVFGSGILTAPVINAFVGTLLVLVVHRLARYAVSQNRARIAGALCAIHPGLIAYSAVVMTEPSAALFVLSAGWAALAVRRGLWGFALAGLLIGLGALIRPASLLALPCLFLLAGRPSLKGLLRVSLAGVVALCSILPWTYRNCQVMDGCTLISTNGGWNLAIGALTETGRFRTLRAADGCPVVTGQVQQDRCWAEVGARKISEDPAHWLRLMPEKLSQTYDHESFPIDYLREASPELWPDQRRFAAHELLTFFHWLLVAAAALSPIALVVAVRKQISAATQSVLLLATAGYASYCFATPEHPFFGLVVMMPFLALLPFPGRPTLGPAGRFLMALVFTTSLTHAVFFGEDRYHLVISPVLCVLAAGALRLTSAPAQWPRASR